MGKIEIYGLTCTIPEQPKPKDIAGYGAKDFRKQKFQRTTIPATFDEIAFDEEGNPIYSEEQQKFILKEIQRCSDGYWFYNKGEPTYITGDHYYYLNFWVLENGALPEYRDADRRWFIFFNEVRNDANILGIIRVKKRREGATNQSAMLLVKTASMGEHVRCGIISKTGGDSADLFSNMVVAGFRSLPPFLQPRTASDEETKKKLVFMKPGAKKKKGVQVVGKREGLNSFVEWRNTAPNSFDSGRWSLMLVDEAGKYEMSIVDYWNVLKKVLAEGAKKVGTAIVVSTVNPPNLGGEEFQKLWEDSNQFSSGRKTKTKLVRYFVPAWDGYAGYIDEWGFSDQEGATENILENYRGNEQDTRDFPLTEQEAFQFAQSESPFNLENIDTQISWLKSNPKHVRRGRMIWNEDKVEFVDDTNGPWHIYKFPQNTNKWIKQGAHLTPTNTHNYVGGVDPFRLNTRGSYSSPGVIHIFQQLDASKPEETGMPVAFYKGRPKEKDLFFEECLKGFMFYGCKGTFEMDATDDYIGYFKKRFALSFLNYTPDEAINRHKKGTKKIERGVRSADPFALEKQLKVCVSYIEHHCHKIIFPTLLEDLKKYQHDNRTERDETVAFMMCLLSALGTSIGQQQEKKKSPMLETYPVNIFR